MCKKVSEKSGWEVNGTRLFESFHQKISRSNRTSEKVVLFLLDGTEIRVPFLQNHLWSQFKAFAAVFRLKELIFANEKHDSGMKFTCPEFCVPFAQTVNCPVCPCKQWTTIMSHSFQKAAFLSYQGNWYKPGTSYKTNKNWWTGTGLKTCALI